MPALVQLVHRLAVLEMLPRQQAGLLELREHAIDRGEADVDALGEQRLVDVLGGQVAHLARLEELEDLASRQRGLQAAVLEALCGHGFGQSCLAQSSAIIICSCQIIRIPVTRFAARRAGSASPAASVPRIPGITPYRMEIQQGNFVTQEMVAQLKPGMTKEQVRFALGTPLLTDIFHADRWDYVYCAGGLERPRASSASSPCYFEDGKLARLDGDVVPARARKERPMRLAVAGAGGRMGRALIEAVLADGEA